MCNVWVDQWLKTHPTNDDITRSSSETRCLQVPSDRRVSRRHLSLHSFLFDAFSYPGLSLCLQMLTTIPWQLMLNNYRNILSWLVNMSDTGPACTRTAHPRVSWRSGHINATRLRMARSFQGLKTDAAAATGPCPKTYTDGKISAQSQLR